MLKRLLWRWLLLAVAIGLVAALMPGVHINGGVLSLLWIAALFAIVNVTIGLLVRVLTAPLLLLTLGLFTLVINAAMFALTAWWSESLVVDSFMADFLAALCVTIVSALLHLIFRGKVRKPAANARQASQVG